MSPAYQWIPLRLWGRFESHAAAIFSVGGDADEAVRIARAAKDAGVDVIELFPPAAAGQISPVFWAHSSSQGVMLWAGDLGYAMPTRKDAEAFLRAACPELPSLVLPMLVHDGGQHA